MKKYILLAIVLVSLLKQTTAQTLGNITILYHPPCGGVGQVDSIVASPIPGATAYHWFSPPPINPTILFDGNPLPYESGSNKVIITFTGTQPSYTICVYAINACCTTDTACITMITFPPQPIMSSTNSSTALPNSSGIYSVLPPPPNSCSAGGAHWSLIPSSAGTITGNGNDTITVNFSSTFTTCLLCCHFQTAFNLNGPDTCMTINAPVGMDEFAASSSEFTVHPNPAGNELFVNDYVSNEKEKEINIYDMLGKEVLKSQIVNPKSQIDISSLKQGIYFIEINNVRKKFVKENF